MGIQTSLDLVREAPRLVDSLRLADDLAFEASRDGGVRTIRVLKAAIAGDDQVVAIAATHALAQVFDAEADAALSDLLSDDRIFLREHAAWAIGTRLPRFDAIPRLIDMVAAGGFAGMLAQRTIEQWSAPIPEHIAIGLESALLGITDAEERYRLVETLGLVRDRIATRPLIRIVKDHAEDELVRVAAVSALGQRREDAAIPALLDELARRDDYLGRTARLAQFDLEVPPLTRSAPGDDLTVVQLFLHADIDAALSQAGSGDNGGIATLLVRLGDALVDRDAAEDRDPAEGQRVRRVLTLSRGPVENAVESVREIRTSGASHVYGSIPLLSGPVASASAWPFRVAARRGIRRLLREAGTVDMLHLRMADVGSLAAADVARELDIPVIFTVAPDPHAVINSMDLSGRLTHANFGDVDEDEHFWFRTRLVQQLAANAAHTVLFPRPELQRDMKELVGIDITAHPERHTVVPEGIDLGTVDAAVAQAADYAAGQQPTSPLAELTELLEGLPAGRRGLPLLVSVGRFHRVKGMATIVEAWQNGPLRDRANLLLIGGNLANPSADEREQLALMDALVPASERERSGLLLSGHQPNDTVARWVAACRFGVPGLAAPRGIYVCGSLKEEFGIALLEAMASGLLVVAPDSGGPATYVESGVTGILTTTWDVHALAAGMTEALAIATAETSDDRSARSRATVERSFTIGAMARALTGVYVGVHRDETELQDGLVTAQ
jgi:glycosyltransferase involved in cell wall biosynthesis